MKFLKKINRGLILTLVVLIAVAIYLVVLSQAQAAAKSEIKNVCERYVVTEISYNMLPEKYRVKNPDISQSEIEQYIEDMTNDIRAFYPDDRQSYKHLISRSKASIEHQAKGIEVIYSYQKDILDYDKFVFDGNTVTVTISSNSSIQRFDHTANDDIGEKVSTITTDTISLIKKDGEWKVIYANLQMPSKQYEDEMSRINKMH